jgi:hypothetical protein
MRKAGHVAGTVDKRCIQDFDGEMEDKSELGRARFEWVAIIQWIFKRQDGGRGMD